MPHSLSQPKPATPSWHSAFLKLVPHIATHARIAFRNLDSENREEHVAEVVANACCAFARLAQLDKLSVAYPSALARYGVAQTKSGRKVGTKLNVNDVTSEYCQREKGVVVERLDKFDPEENQWLEAVIVDTRSAPVPDTVAFRMDFVEWLARLPKRDGRVAKFLALGHRTSDAARKFAVTQGRIAQLKRVLAASWVAFRGEDGSTARVDPVAA
jgi:hypothetical protein